ncbi:MULTISPECIES: SMI1/KNR4 family protein [unclassified Thermoactinomyces]|uniref:SMI1/KNR4 family protein n=1 Tax=unclassified Thermoactinomyces TaxID=2634588 RepID=UPI0018DB190D|nr:MULTISPECIES: SMI1/KNR4 family protein [unclassified Thermoactinomyces]MBH8596806.1 SMI1/KNR4 family protein [Thermoactinomyces sp. CICC 10523]MBH8606731.1 SMI1/KNR4 family protein [Thermoactinomyces sp. CICC 10521]
MSKQLEWEYSHGEIQLDDIRKVEKQLGIRFPSEYNDIILKYHPITVSPDVLYLPGVRDIVLTDFASFNPDAEHDLYILLIYEYIKDRLVDHVYPFVYEASGDCLCFDYRNEKEEPKIVLWDHEEAAIDKEKGLFPICDSFGEFLELLKKG